MKDELDIKFQGVSKSFPNQGGDFFQACRELSFDVKKGEIVAIVEKRAVENRLLSICCLDFRNQI